MGLTFGHSPAAQALPRPVWQERDIHGYRYATPLVWGGPWQDRARTERWLDETEPDLRRDWQQRTRTLLAACERVAEAQQGARRAAELIPLLLAFSEQEVDFNALVWAAPQSLGWVCEDLLQHLLASIAPGYPVAELLQGLPCYSYERTAAAEELGRALPADVSVALVQQPLDQVIPYLQQHAPSAPFLRDYERFCYRFGLRPPGWPSSWARWSFRPSGEWGQDPLQTLLVVRGRARGEARDVVAVHAACARHRRDSEQALRRITAERAPALLPRLTKILAWAQFWVPVLDDRKWHVVARVRLADLLRHIGLLLVAEGGLDAPDNLLLLTVADLQRVTSGTEPYALRDLYRMRQREVERDGRLRPPEVLGPSPAHGPAPATASLEIHAAPAGALRRVLHGQGLAPGRVVGIGHRTAQVNAAAYLDTLAAGQIILCAAAQTWDTDWLSLLMMARGLVTTQGTGLHHAVQIARECGVPFVNLPDSDLQSIPDGARLALDGAAGTVTLLDEASADL
jgi:phosphohistidine swiveling domain-containing protein